MAIAALIVVVAVFGALDPDDDGGDDTATDRTTSAEQPSTSPAAPADDQADNRTFPGGQPLSGYRTYESYPWRVAIVDQQDELLSDLQAVASWIDDGDFADVVSVCDAVASGMQSGPESAVYQFSKGPGEQVTQAQGEALYAVIGDRAICPVA